MNEKLILQVFVPFISDVRVGSSSSSQEPTEAEEIPHSLLTVTSSHHHGGTVFLDRPGRGGGSLSGGTSGGAAVGGSGAGGATGGGGEKLTPPSSPNISKYAFDLAERSRSESDRSNNRSLAFSTSSFAASNNSDSDLMELQLDYWLNEKMAALMRSDNGDQRRSESDSKPRKPLDPKSSIRTTFRSLTITHLAAGGQGSSCGSEHCFAMSYVTKEKRLGKAVLKIGKKKVSWKNLKIKIYR